MSKSTRNKTVILATAAVGMTLAVWLTYLHVMLHTDFGYTSICGTGKSLNCETVAASVYSVFAGLPVSGWAALAYLAVFVLLLFDMGEKKEDGTIGILTVLCGLMAASSISLALVSAFVIKAICLMCAASQVVSLVLVVVTVLEARNRGGLRVNLRNEIGRFKRDPAIPMYLGGLLVIGILAGPVGLIPRYWTYAFFRTHSSISHGFDDEGRAWIGASSPELEIHEYFDYECPSCRLSHRKLRNILGKNSDEVRLVRHNFARMKCAPNDSVRRNSRCALARGAFCAGEQGKHWEWNDAIIANPKPVVGPARKVFELELAQKLSFDTKKFEQCLFDAKTIDFVQGHYLEAKKKRISSTPIYIIDGKKIPPKDLKDRIGQLL